ncbi:monogalactosyldiacylglycerol (MGDG) synthase family protein [Anoxybacillus sp. B7M1]|uniref:MGDG synthase family glycosyltransferase n=1 Tax=unclassified Anoxybacillus TaxID=2639704 RepID=UPI0005CD4DB3|nr:MULTISPECIES: galactosyldiacylglycerol synthase [unclassified Anoxybacillus]ANB55944.1 monogalactosyldiacylglycerol (MGDG) synthase family protein [Anoxybacillus sp. B2M1]ANB63607.1 monogalactosyldiacylglycerol (MGDG) synthase family protein [Anoxybacillus sp. B7M1]
MMRVLVLPLFQMSSGHHKVADALMDFLEQQFSFVSCKKVDFLSYCNEYIEKLVSEVYLRWIRSHPSSYHHIYKMLMYRDVQKIEWIHLEPWMPYFEHKMKRMLEKEKPHFIICTHSFPSRILHRLKRRHLIDIPVVNVYTDFFINGIWGKKAIDYHFVPHQEAKKELITKYKIPKERIVVTGIPVHETFMTRKNGYRGTSYRPHLLVAGGNQGLGNILDFFRKMNGTNRFRYSVLCGNNNELYEEILRWKQPHIQPFSYISNCEEMNRLYDEVDAVITKPGGVTVSEVLHKRIPLFTIGYLPGQEQINLRYLESKGLIYNLSRLEHYEQKIWRVLHDHMEKSRFHRRVAEYFSQIEQTAQDSLKELILMHEKNQKVLSK